MANNSVNSRRKLHPWQVIEIQVIPCEQQQNGSDCGVFTMFNGIDLANGYLPEELIYTGQNK